MIKLYIDNFRGFYNTIIDFKKVNFLVGENSTGKSSILALLKLMSGSHFSINPSFNFEEVELGYFKDIASKRKQNYFEIGILSDTSRGIEKDEVIAYLMRFVEKDGKPHLLQYRYISGRSDIKLVSLSNKNFKYTFRSMGSNFNRIVGKKSDEFFKKWIENERYQRKFKTLKIKEKGFPDLLGVLFEVGNKVGLKSFRFPFAMPFGSELTLIAPIRAKPKRIYEQFKNKQTAEGEHIPILLKRLLDPTIGKKELITKLEKFGKESGLFNKVETRDVGKDPQTSPFEVLITINHKRYKIPNVGYGLSQVLPLIIEILNADRDQWIAIQQPEIHLHPKAQASFGDVIVDSVMTKKINFLIETHSEYTVDRFRLSYKKVKSNDIGAQVLFFEKKRNKNIITPIRILSSGKYEKSQPSSFKTFFINEELSLLEI